jgi:imidazolonepropionase-like amidohydrolase
MHATLIGLACALFAEATPASGELPPAAGPLLAIQAQRVVVDARTVLEDATVIVEGDRIREVGVGLTVPSGATVVQHQGTLTAGFVAPHSTLLSPAERSDSTRPFLAEVELRHGFDREAEACEEAIEAGVTCAVLTPSPENVVGGVTAVVSTHGGTVLEPRAHLALSVSAAAAQPNRYPTSYSGIAHELERRFGPDASGVYAEVKGGQLPVLIAADSGGEVQRAIEFCTRHGIGGALLGGGRAGEQLEPLRRSGLGVVLSPFGPGFDDRTLQSMVALANSDVPLAFALTDARLLRFSAAALVRAGAQPEAVLAALTSGGARLAGVDDQVGALRRGLRADLLLWSGDPLDLTSSLEAVYVGGELVHQGLER